MNRVNAEFDGRLGRAPGVTISSDDSSTKLAAQAIAGVALAIGEPPRPPRVPTPPVPVPEADAPPAPPEAPPEHHTHHAQEQNVFDIAPAPCRVADHGGKWRMP